MLRKKCSVPSAQKNHASRTIVRLLRVERKHLVLGSLLVDIGGSVVLLLVDLVANGVLASGETGGNVSVAVLGNLLVGLLGAGRGST